MSYKKFDTLNWPRKEHFEVFKSYGQCLFNMTVEIDISILMAKVKSNNFKFYPTIIHLVSSVFNQYPEFKLAMKDDELIIWDKVNPSYTIFHKDNETFSSIWSEHKDDYKEFLNEYQSDQDTYKDNLAYFPKEHIENVFYISAIPWASFTNFNLNFTQIDNFFTPICTIGKFFEKDGKTLLPVALQVHHAVSDGFHAARFFTSLQESCNKI